MARNANSLIGKKPEQPPVASTVNARSGQKVTVACKLPNGIVLQLNEKFTEREQTPLGPRPVDMWRPVGPKVRILGCAAPFGKTPEAGILAGGYALTHNVDRDFMEKWLEQHSADDVVVNKLVFVAASRDSAEGEAKEHEAVRSGLEPLNPARKITTGRDGGTISLPVDARWPRGTRNVSSPEAGTRDPRA